MQKESLAAREEMRNIREEVDWKEERFRLLSDKVDNTMADAEREAEDCKLVAMHRRQVMAAWRPCGSNSSPWEQMELRPLYRGSKGKWEQHKGRCQEEKNDEGVVKMNKSKAKSVSSWCYQRQAGSMKAHQRVVWSLIFIVFV